MWIVIGSSESGDHYYALLTVKPSAYTRSKLAHSWDGCEEKTGGGEDGSYVYVTVLQVEPDEALKKIK